MKHFTLSEFECTCCGQVNMDKDFLKMLDEARDIAEMPFIVSSGYRCAKHNKEIGGSKDSAHLTGRAADIVCGNNAARKTIILSLLATGFTRIGVGKNFIHVDSDVTKMQNVMWLYD